MLKRIIAVLLVALMLVLLCACQGSEDDAGTTTRGEEGSTTKPQEDTTTKPSGSTDPDEVDPWTPWV